MSATDVSSGPRRLARPGQGQQADATIPATPPQPSRVAALGGVWIPGLIAGIAITVAVWGLVLPLTVALRGDELTSLFLYSGRGPAGIWGHYITNDHMLYELATWAFRGFTGDHSVAAVRFWAVVPAAAALVVGAVWLWRRLDPWVAAVFSVLVCAAPGFTDLGDEGRGYGLMFLSATVMVIAGDWAARRKRTGAVALFGVAALAGIFTSPVMAVMVAVLAALLVAKLGWRRDLLGALAIVAVASVAFYAPVIDGLSAATGAGAGRQLPPLGFITGPLIDLLQPSVQAVIHPVTSSAAGTYLAHLLSARGAPGAVDAELIGAAAVALGVVVLRASVERFLAAALLLPTVVTYAAFEVLRSHVIGRFASFFLPGLLMLIAAGLVGVARRAARTPALSALVVAAGVALCAIVVGKGYRLATFNARAARSATIYSNQPSAFAGYLDPRDITLAEGGALEQMACDKPGAFALLDYQLHPLPLATAECLRARNVYEAATVELASGRQSVPGLVLDVPAKR